MLKTIQKIFLCSFFISSSVFPMRQIAQAGLTSIFSKTPIAQVAVAKAVIQKAAFRDTLIARCSILESLLSQDIEHQISNEQQVRVASQNQEMHSSNTSHVSVSDVLIIDENTIECRMGSRYDFNTNVRTEQSESGFANGDTSSGKTCSGQSYDHSWKSSFPADVIQMRHKDSVCQAQQHLSEIFQRFQQEELCQLYNDKAKSIVSAYISNFSEIVQTATRKFVNFDVLPSSQQVVTHKTVLSQKLSELQNAFLSIQQKNPNISFIADATQCGFNEIPYHVKDRWTDLDYCQACVALQLKADIEAIKVAIEMCDCIIHNNIKKEVFDFTNKLQSASVVTIEKEILPDLIARKEQIDAFIDHQQAHLKVTSNKAQDIERQIKEIEQQFFIARLLHRSTYINLLNQLEAAQVEQAQINQQLPCLYYDQAKYSQQIGQAWQIIDEKNQLALQEAQLLQENIEKNTVYNEVLQSQHDACDFSREHCFDHELEFQWSQRQEALLRTIDQGYVQYEQEFILNPQTVAFLDVCGFDYKKMQSFFGTALQQQLHGQICYVLSQAAAMQKPLPCQKGLLVNVVNFAAAAYDANKNNQVLLAARLLDVDSYLLKLNHQICNAIMTNSVVYAQAVVSGLAHGVADIAHMLTSPCETIKGLGKALHCVLETIALNTSEDVVLYPEIYGPMRDKRNAEIVAALKNLGHQFETSTGPQRVEALVRFGTNFYAPGKVIHAIGEVCGFVHSQAKGLQTLEGVVSLLEEQGIAQDVLQAAEKVTVATQEHIAKSLASELVNAEHIVSRVKTGLPKKCKILTLEEVVKKLEKCQGKISVKKEQELYHNVKYYIEKANAQFKKVNETLLKECKRMTPMIDNPEISVCIDIEHTINPHYKLVRDSTGSFDMVELKGGHLAGTMLKLEKEGLVKIISSSPEFGSGCVQYQVKDLLTGLEFINTEFPPHWTSEKIAQEIRTACEHGVRSGLLNGEVSQPLYVTTNDGFKLKIITNSKPLNHTCKSIENTINKHVVTAHPIFEVK